MAGQRDTRTCYYPAGNKAPGTVPCTGEKVTHCCGRGDICMSNGYCLDVNQPFLVARGACTKKKWGPGCPGHCRDVSPKKGCAIISFATHNNTATYCCGTPVGNGSSTMCPQKKKNFQLEDGYILPGRAVLENVTSLDAAPADSDPAAPSSNDTSNSLPSSSNSHNTHRDVAIGAGVGIPLAVMALAALIWALWERRRATRFRHAAFSAPVVSSLPPGFARTPSGVRSKNSGPTELGQQSLRPPELEARQ